MQKIEGRRIHVGVRIPEAEHYALKQVALDQKTTVQALLLAVLRTLIQR